MCYKFQVTFSKAFEMKDYVLKSVELVQWKKQHL